MKQKILLILLFLTLSLTGCAELVSAETREVDVRIVDTYHRAMWVQPIPIGKVTTVITHPAIHEVTVEYNGTEYEFDGSDLYNSFKDCVGQTVTGILEIRSYNDGTVKYEIVDLVREEG